ncbi:MAG: Spy/CpxP family protein refolding chaperone [Candidatus Fermentibacteria bacterium]
MSVKMKTIGITILALLVLAGTAIAQGPGGWSPHADGPGGRIHEMGPGAGGPGQQGGFGIENLARFREMFRHIDLSDEQIEEIRSITETARAESMEIMQEAGRPEDHPSFMDIFTSPTLTVSDLENAVGRMNEVRDEMQAVIFEAIVDIHDVLTLEQLDELSEIAHEHAEGMGHGTGMDHGSGMGHPMR